MSEEGRTVHRFARRRFARSAVVGRAFVAAVVVAVVLALAGPAVAAPPPGPPFPAPENGRAVYDQAGVFRPQTIAEAERTIDGIEERTGAEVVVYTQVAGDGVTTDEAEQHARALMDQWGIGRKGFDDGLVILYDLDSTKIHGQIQLYAGPGYREAFLSNQERQAVYENDMLPLLRSGDLDGALLSALRPIDANATPEHAATLQFWRQVNAVLGLVGAPIILLGLIGWAAAWWWRFGRDPIYLDDPSILMPAPPPELTAASGALVLDGRSSRRALTTAMLDLASRGLIAFREEHGPLGMNRKVGVEVEPAALDAVTEARRGLNQRRPIGPAEQYALGRLRSLGHGGYIEPDELLGFGQDVGEFDRRLEAHVVDRRWFAERPAVVTNRWLARGGGALILGIIGAVIGFNLPSDGVLLLGVALAVAGLAIVVLARSMPAVTMSGAMIRAMLAAYRRTLEKTMAQARSMNQVVDEAGLDWLDTPDQAVVWGLALGLEKDVERVLERTIEDVREGAAPAATYVPAWYSSGPGGGGGGGPTGGLMSSSALPNVGGMMAALGTIGNSPSSSGSGGGGFGGGGGGAGGGF